ncbi:MAG: DUF87 domain-containing protein [Nanoarchaeota archaeon]
MLQKLSIEEVCSKLRPIFGKKIDDLYLRYAMSESNEERDEIVHVLNALYQRDLNDLLETKILLEPPKREVIDGDYPLAVVSYSGKKLFPFSLREKDWPRHVCISGMSGSGKTTLAFNILANFINHNKPFLVFDWKKSFRPLILAGSDVMCFTVGDDSVSNLFRININQPPKGIDPKEWINVLCDLLTECFFVSYGVHKVLLETLDEAFKEWGVYEGSENYPTWENIKWYLEQKLDKTRGREAGWLESAMRIASVMTFGNFGKVCSSKDKDSLTIEDILNKKVILELNSLSSIEKKFFCEFILTYIYKLKKSRQKNIRGEFDHAILVDEAHNIFLKESTNFTKESVTDMVYREMREYGTSLICLDQHISKLSDTVKGNSACVIAFQQQLPQDIYDISGLMQMKEQKQFFSMLPVGSAIVKLSERYNSPFLIEVSPVELREYSVSDSQVRERTKSLIMGIEVEKGVDPEFNKNLMINQEPVEISVYHDRIDVKKIEKEKDIIQETEIAVERKPFREKSFEIKQEVSEVKEPIIEVNIRNNENILTLKQKVLYDFVQRKLSEGEQLKDLENLLEKYRNEGRYTLSDIARVINYSLEIQFKESNVGNINLKSVTTFEKQKIHKQKPLLFNKELDVEQEMFLSFLLENQNNDYSTVNIYKMLGLSSRKGNKIKNELLRKNLIQIQEQKNEKGWKKIISLAPNTLTM